MQENSTEPTVQGILHALSDPLRMAIFIGLKRAEGGCNCSTFLEIDQRAIPKSTLSQHLKVLRDAGLIVSEKRGVEVFNRIRCEALQHSPLLPMIESIAKAYIQQQTVAAKS